MSETEEKAVPMAGYAKAMRLDENTAPDGLGGFVPIVTAEGRTAAELEDEWMLDGNYAEMQLRGAGFVDDLDNPRPDDPPEEFSRLQRIRDRLAKWPVIGWKR